MKLTNCIWADISRPANNTQSISAYVDKCLNCNPDRVFLVLNDAHPHTYLHTWNQDALINVSKALRDRGVWVGWMYHTYTDIVKCRMQCNEWRTLFAHFVPDGLQCDAEQTPWHHAHDAKPASNYINETIKALKVDIYPKICEFSATTITKYPTNQLRSVDFELVKQSEITHAYNQAYLFWDGREGHWSQSMPHSQGTHQRNIAKPWVRLFKGGLIKGWYMGCANYGQSFPAHTGIQGLDAMRWGVVEAQLMADEGLGCEGVAWWSLKHATAEKIAIMDIHTPEVAPASGEEIKEMQSALNLWGYDAGAVDGIIGPRTTTAAQAYLNMRDKVRGAKADELYRKITRVYGDSDG